MRLRCANHNGEGEIQCDASIERGKGSEIAPDFHEKNMTTVRVSNVTPILYEQFKKRFPETTVQIIPNGTTLIDITEHDHAALGDIIQFLTAHQLTEFSFGKVTLNDLYSMTYQLDK